MVINHLLTGMILQVEGCHGTLGFPGGIWCRTTTGRRGPRGILERGNLVVKTCLNFGEWRVNDVLYIINIYIYINIGYIYIYMYVRA